MISYGTRLRQLAESRPHDVALVEAGIDGAERSLTWDALHQWARQLADTLVEHQVRPGRVVTVVLPNGLEHYVAAYATWLVGGCVLPLSPQLPAAELDALHALADPAAVLTAVPAWDGERRAALPDVTPEPGRAMASGGSTGRPKLIVDPAPLARVPGLVEPLLAECGIGPRRTALVGGALHHNVSFTWSHLTLFEGGTVVVLRRFDADRYLDLVERWRPTFLPLVPTMMSRLVRTGRSADLSSVTHALHTGAPCPTWLKRAWIDLVGPEHLVEAYGGTEGLGATVIRGDEWQEHPGSVGRPRGCSLAVRDEQGRSLPPGEVGHIWLRPDNGRAPSARYLGAAPLVVDSEGFSTLGDLGWLDADGYLFIADRRTDLILTGGVNVYPAEVEAALSEHPGVADVAVVGLPDDDWGQRVHAVVQASGTVTAEELLAHCATLLSPVKRPKTLDLVEALPRDGAGKLRRAQLRDALLQQAAS